MRHSATESSLVFVSLTPCRVNNSSSAHSGQEILQRANSTLGNALCELWIRNNRELVSIALQNIGLASEQATEVGTWIKQIQINLNSDAIGVFRMATKGKTKAKAAAATTASNGGTAKSYKHPEAEAVLRPDIGTQAQFKKRRSRRSTATTLRSPQRSNAMDRTGHENRARPWSGRFWIPRVWTFRKACGSS